jgi:predicted transcriptional regulator
MGEFSPIPKAGASKPHPSHPIVGRAMRQLALWWPKPVNIDEGMLVLDLSQSRVWENRIAMDAENCDLAKKSFEWLQKGGLIELSQDSAARNATLTKEGLDFIHSVSAFQQFEKTTSRLEREALIPTLDMELSRCLGPGFLSWLQDCARRA